MQRTAHIRCGSDIRESLKTASVAGDFFEWSDPLSRGPVPEGLDRDALRRLRADWMASHWGDDPSQILEKLEAQDAALDRLDDYDRVILWFEHDLYDQATLMGLLDLIGYRSNLYLLSIDRHPNHDQFIGFGQLQPGELAQLVGSERKMTPEQVIIAREGYALYRGADPAALKAFAERPDTGKALPFLPGALMRHLAELPSETNGLSLTERLTLQALDEGAATPGECFRDLVRKLDPQPFLGDLMYWEDVMRLAKADAPAFAPMPENWRSPVTLTEFGRALLNREARWTDRNRLDRWWGGKQLTRI
ncbi:DUF1835 domain-containing protein [Pacificispira sp.]|uniref:DUF1835 domain-containing protein n=1 Tax=Pacificispira sp. TaxID=2888761 RepID=UPI003BA9AA55